MNGWLIVFGIIVLIVGFMTYQTLKELDECKQIGINDCDALYTENQIACFNDCKKLEMTYLKWEQGFGSSDCWCIDEGDSNQIW